MKHYDVIVIGSGASGQTAAYDLNRQGLNVALVECDDEPGGTCALAGCQAKKWFYETAEVIAKSKHLEKKGIITPAVGDWHSVWKQKKAFTDKVPKSTVDGLTAAGITFLKGTAKFTDANHIDVAAQQYGADYFVIAAGGKPISLPINGAEKMADSKAFMARESLPRRIVFIGGGFISLEFAHFAARIGPEEREIVILEVADRVLGPFDKDMVDLIVQASNEDGIKIQTNTQVSGIEKKGGAFEVKTGSGRTLEADLVVNGAGRVPQLEALQLENAGVKSTRKGIEVNSRMQTSAAHIFAVGDCAATIALARVADFEAHVAARNILAEKGKGARFTVDYTSVPSVLFTYPQYGMVGETEEALQNKGVSYKKSTDKDLQWPTYRRVGIEHAGYKILISEDGLILGAHVVSDNPAGLINTFTQAMRNGITVEDIYWSNIMSPYPSRESDIIYMLSPLLG